MVDGRKTILVVDDNEDVRTMAGLFLRREGYNVLEAADGLEALRLFTESRERIDLLLSDIVMPGMNGSELAETIRLLRPGVRVLLMSGHSDGLAFSTHEASAFLPKPFTMQSLAQKIRETLSGKHPGPVQHGSLGARGKDEEE